MLDLLLHQFWEFQVFQEEIDELLPAEHELELVVAAAIGAALRGRRGRRPPGGGAACRRVHFLFPGRASRLRVPPECALRNKGSLRPCGRRYHPVPLADIRHVASRGGFLHDLADLGPRTAYETLAIADVLALWV